MSLPPVPTEPTDIIDPQTGRVIAYLYPTESAPGGVAVDTTSLAGGHYLNTLSMNKVFDLLVHMMDILQKVAIAQADQLKFLTSWQRAYTDRMANIHSFVAKNGDASYISGTSTENGTARQDLNQTNTTITETDRSYSQIVGDTAKSLQANIAATQDALTQQSNMATSILQQMASLLAAIYR